MLVNGINAIRDLWDTLHDAGEVGTGTTQETSQDTDLQTVITGSESTTVTSTLTDQMLKKDVRLLGVNSGSEEVTEMIWKTQSPEKAGSRVVFPTSQTFNDTSDLVVETRWFWRGRRD